MLHITGVTQILNKVFKEQETGGSIINVASVAGYLGARGGTSYTMSKHASIGLTKNIAAFHGSHGEGKTCANVICQVRLQLE